MRRPREIKEGSRYHVTARANRKEMIFASEGMKLLFLATVKRAKKKYHFQLEKFCIMGNHFHFVIRPGKGENISVIMRWILGVFAMSYNRTKGLTGHVWGDRFFSRIISSMWGLQKIFQYIDSNPAKAGLVERGQVWPWCGSWHTSRGCRRLLE